MPLCISFVLSRYLLLVLKEKDQEINRKMVSIRIRSRSLWLLASVILFSGGRHKGVAAFLFAPSSTAKPKAHRQSIISEMKDNHSKRMAVVLRGSNQNNENKDDNKNKFSALQFAARTIIAMSDQMETMERGLKKGQLRICKGTSPA